MNGQVEATTELDLERLAAYLRGHRFDIRGLTARLVSGGRSNLTFLLDVETPQGARRWILRRPPLGHVLATAHDMGREHRVVHALRDSSVPVPRSVVAGADPAVIGAPFYLMEYVEGDILRSDEAVRDLGAQAADVGDSLVDVLAALHAVDPAAAGLSDFGRPQGFMERQVRRWTTQLESSRSRELPRIDDLARALAAAVPAEAPASLIHGDFRLDNCLIRDGRVAAVLDWEMATLGDPLADVALFVVYTGGFTESPGAVIHSPAGVGSFPTTARMLERYVDATGRDLGDFSWYLGFAWFKLAVILEGIHYRNVLGKSASDEFVGVAEAVPFTVERGCAALFDREAPA